jgi:hypothetical protein
MINKQSIKILKWIIANPDTTCVYAGSNANCKKYCLIRKLKNEHSVKYEEICCPTHRSKRKHLAELALRSIGITYDK